MVGGSCCGVDRVGSAANWGHVIKHDVCDFLTAKSVKKSKRVTTSGKKNETPQVAYWGALA